MIDPREIKVPQLIPDIPRYQHRYINPFIGDNTYSNALQDNNTGNITSLVPKKVEYGFNPNSFYSSSTGAEAPVEDGYSKPLTISDTWSPQEALRIINDPTSSLDDVSLNNIMYHEGYREKPYRDFGNNAWDVGFGYQGPEINENSRMSVREAKQKVYDFVMNNRRKNKYAYDAFKGSPEATIILDDLGYNLKNGLNYDSIQQAIRSGDLEQLINASLLYTGARGAHNDVLAKRRQFGANLVRNWRNRNGN